MKKIFVLLSALILSSVAPLYASYCIHCSKNLKESANFCSNCGQAVYKSNENNATCNNSITTKTNVIYSDGVTTTSTVKTLSTYVPNSNTQIIYKNEYYCPTPVTKTVVVKEEPSCDPLLGLAIWGIIHNNHHKHHHVRHLPPPPPHHAPKHPVARKAGFKR